MYATGNSAGVTVHGVGFKAPRIVVDVGGKEQSCDVLGPQQAICQVKESRTGQVALTVRGAEMQPEDVMLIIDEPAKLVSIVPSFGPALGGTVVDVRGSGFVNGSHLQCRFGQSRASVAKFESSNLVRCISPRFLPGIVDLVISSSFSPSPFSFKYKPSSAIVSISPSLTFELVAVSLTITGDRFEHELGTKCIFGN